MPGDMMQLPCWRLDMAKFHGFRDDRPRHEKWELIDGRPVMMPPPSLVHQRICRNLETMLNERLLVSRPAWAADREIGLLIPDDDKFNPEPDVTVIDTDVEMGQIYAQRFYFVAEVLSGSDKAWVLQAKLDYYRGHEHCGAVLFVRQDAMAAAFYARNSNWAKTDLTIPGARIAIPGVGDIGPLSGLYRFTPLALPAT